MGGSDLIREGFPEEVMLKLKDNERPPWEEWNTWTEQRGRHESTMLG